MSVISKISGIVIICSLLICPLTVSAAAAAATPGATVKNFFTAMAKADFATAKKVVLTKELVGLIQFVEEMAKENPELKKEAAADFKHFAQGKVVSEKITGDTAAVVYEYKEKNKIKKETYKLKKISGQWKIVD